MNHDRHDNVVSLSKKAAANRRNAQLSTGPRTDKGKGWSRRNALKHGILASAVLITKGSGAEDSAEFEQLLDSLQRDLAPVGALEEMLVEKIAVCWWRQKRALRCEVGLVRKQFAAAARLVWQFECEATEAIRAIERQENLEGLNTEEPLENGEGEEEISNEEWARDQKMAEDDERVMDDLSLPQGHKLNLILRYEAAVQRQLVHAINQLERLQRARKGEHVPAPVSVQVSTDHQ